LVSRIPNLLLFSLKFFRILFDEVSARVAGGACTHPRLGGHSAVGALNALVGTSLGKGKEVGGANFARVHSSGADILGEKSARAALAVTGIVLLASSLDVLARGATVLVAVVAFVLAALRLSFPIFTLGASA
jgi:hypothetical protein